MLKIEIIMYHEIVRWTFEVEAFRLEKISYASLSPIKLLWKNVSFSIFINSKKNDYIAT